MDSEQEQPLHSQEIHFSHAGDVLDVIDHKHNPAPGSLPSPNPQRKSRTYESNPEGQYKNEKRRAPGGADEKAVRTKTVGRIGNN